MPTHRNYTVVLKLKVVRMVIEQGMAISKLSANLFFADNLIRRWVKQYQLEQSGSLLQGTNPLTPAHEQYIAQDPWTGTGKPGTQI